MVAYALYKQAKQDWARLNPRETDRSAFQRAITDSQIRMFRSLAEQMMAANAWAGIVGSVLFAVFLFLVGVAFFSPGIKTFFDAANTAAPSLPSPRIPAGSTGAAP